MCRSTATEMAELFPTKSKNAPRYVTRFHCALNDITGVFICILLAFCQSLCYAVNGATSTPAGGSPRCYSGVYFYFAPVRYRKGVLHLVTWPNLIEFCSFLVALITLIIGILDHKNKK